MRAWLRPACIVFVIVVGTLFLLPAHLLAMAFEWRLRRRTAMVWHKMTAGALGLRITCRGQPPGKAPVLIVSNHVSWLDIVVLGAVAPVSFIAKEEVRDWPVFNWLARWQETLFINRTRGRHMLGYRAAMGERLDAGDTLVLFAEGTTGDGNRLMAMRSPFLAAVAGTRATVVPVAIVYRRWYGIAMTGRERAELAGWPGDVGLAPHLVRILREGVMDVDIVFGPPAPDAIMDDRKALTRWCAQHVSAMLSAGITGRDASKAVSVRL